MARYTRRNLRADLDDQAQAYGLAPSLEYRVARDALETTESAPSFLRLAPGFRLPFGHHHRRQEEVDVLIHGSARLKLDDEVLDLGPWDAVRIERSTVRGIEGGPDGAELPLFGAPRVDSATLSSSRAPLPAGRGGRSRASPAGPRRPVAAVG